MHSCVFSVHSSIRPWSRSPQIYFLLGFSSDASIKLWEDDDADFRCRGGLRFMIGWSSENSRIWFISAKALQKWWQSQFSNPMGFIPSKSPCSTFYIFSTTTSSWFSSGDRIKSKSNFMASNEMASSQIRESKLKIKNLKLFFLSAGPGLGSERPLLFLASS